MFENPLLRFISWICTLAVRFGSNLQSLFLLWMRVTWGHQLFLAGTGKLHNMEQTIQFFTSLHLPSPALHAHLVAYLETIGGPLLIIGFASRLISIPLILIMLTALSTAHAAALSGFRFATEPATLVMQAPYPFLITSLLVFIFGPGRISLDALIKHWTHRQPKF